MLFLASVVMLMMVGGWRREAKPGILPYVNFIKQKLIGLVKF